MITKDNRFLVLVAAANTATGTMNKIAGKRLFVEVRLAGQFISRFMRITL
jgi:hypothetical protein